jgi:hypothetical protein
MASFVGKNFSSNNASGNRKESDLYETPYSLTRLLLTKEALYGKILEPACGNGAICKILDENKLEYDSYDIEEDFLTEKNHYDVIITNPPFSIAYDFILKAKEVSDRFIFLLPLSYLHGKQRYDDVWMDRDFPLEKIYVFTRYPMLGDDLREDGKHRTGMMVYAWYVWNRYHKEDATINWLDNQPFILSKADQ